MKTFAGALLLSGLASGNANAQAQDTTGLEPFIAQYEAAWKGMAVGTSEIRLTRGAELGTYMYVWTITARGIFRLAYRDDLVQKSWVTVVGDHVRPDKYFGKEGSQTVELNFDWHDKRATGVSETKPVDIALPDGAQDVMSIQVE